jgi:hypothetical protein
MEILEMDLQLGGDSIGCKRSEYICCFRLRKKILTSFLSSLGKRGIRVSIFIIGMNERTCVPIQWYNPNT